MVIKSLIPWVAILTVSFLFLSQRPGTAGSYGNYYGDIILNRNAEKTGMKPVVFPHWWHRIRFQCQACHEEIFVMEAGANDITMEKIFAGEYCGKCHNGTISWEPTDCNKCHSYGVRSASDEESPEPPKRKRRRRGH